MDLMKCPKCQNHYLMATKTSPFGECVHCGKRPSATQNYGCRVIIGIVIVVACVMALIAGVGFANFFLG